MYHRPEWYPVPFGSYKRDRADLVQMALSLGLLDAKPDI